MAKSPHALSAPKARRLALPMTATMKEDVVVATITVHSTEQNLIVVSIIWAGYTIAFFVTSWRVFKSWKDGEREESSSGDTSRNLVR